MWCFANKNLHENCRMGRRIVVMKLICSLGHCECDGHTAHKLSQRRLTADWLAPRESDCLRMHSKVSSDRLSSYLTARRPVLEIFKMAGYFPDSPCIRSNLPVHYSNRFSTILVLSFRATFKTWDKVYLSLVKSFHITEDCRSLIAEVLIRYQANKCGIRFGKKSSSGTY